MSRVHHERVGRARVARSNEPGYDQLRVRIDRGPRPHRTDAELALLLGGDVLILRTNERPNLVALNAARTQAMDRLVLVLCAGRAEVHQQLENRRLRHAGHAGRRADAVAFDQWLMKSFRISHFDKLDARPLAETVERLRGITRKVGMDEDIIAKLAELREG
jgi:hypothetical protein